MEKRLSEHSSLELYQLLGFIIRMEVAVENRLYKKPEGLDEWHLRVQDAILKALEREMVERQTKKLMQHS